MKSKRARIKIINMPMKKLLLFLFIFSMNLSSKEEQTDSLKILVYNTHGLPEIFINDNPKNASP